MKRVTVIGARGFVGSAFVRLLTGADVELRQVTRVNYAEFAGETSDIVIDASGNSAKYLADRDPVAEFDRSATHRLRTLCDFPAALHVHLSSVDVYHDLTSQRTTTEDFPIDIELCSRYGAH